MRTKRWKTSNGKIEGVARPLLAGVEIEESVTARQEHVPGFDQSKVAQTGVFLAGAGGLAREPAVGIVRKGYGRIGICDMDAFEPSNFSRQFCYKENLFKNKALEVAQNLSRECVAATAIEGYAMPFQDAIRQVRWSDYSVIVCGVDNNPTRVAVSRFARQFSLPAIFCGVSNDAGSGYIFVQDVAGPCFGCVFPQKAHDIRHPCPNTPACLDILAVLGGYTLYAIDSLVMERKRFWNLRHVFLDGSVEDACLARDHNPDCPLCGHAHQP